MKKLFALLVTLSACVSVTAFAGNVAAGKVAAQKYNCAACHGADYNTPIDGSYPKLAGQHADYIDATLRAYQRGADGAYGRSNAIMGGIAKALTKTEISDLSAYISSLKGSLVLRK